MATADVIPYLEGVELPVRKRELLRRARANEAPEAVLDQLKQMDDGTYENMAEVKQAIEKTEAT